MLDASEVRSGGMLIGYAMDKLSPLHMEQVEQLLAVDLSLGEELEQVLIDLENSGWLPPPIPV